MWRYDGGKEVGGPSTDGAHLVEECEAFLEGHWANVLDAFGQPVSPLAWLNVLAHGSIPDIIAASHWVPSEEVHEMTVATLSVGRSDSLLRDLQSAALIPLELELLGAAEIASFDTQQLLVLVLGAVESFRRLISGL